MRTAPGFEPRNWHKGTTLPLPIVTIRARPQKADSDHLQASRTRVEEAKGPQCFALETSKLDKEKDVWYRE